MISNILFSIEINSHESEFMCYSNPYWLPSSGSTGRTPDWRYDDSG